MKKIFQLLAVATLGVALLWSCQKEKPDITGNEGEEGDEVVLLNETFGTTATGNPVLSDYTGYSKTGKGAANVVYEAVSGKVDVRTTSPSKSYTGASASCNAMLDKNNGTAMVVKNIASCGARNITLTFGSSTSGDVLAVAYSADNGATWSAPIEYTKTTTNWGPIVGPLSFALPEGTTCFALKFYQVKAVDSEGYNSRIDDITVKTTDATGEAAVCEGAVLPPVNFDVPEISIDSLRALNADAAKTAKVTIPADKKIVGIVISDGTTQNSVPENIQLVSEDNSAGIMVRFASEHSFVVGDKVEIVVSGQSLEFYRKLLQVNGVPNANVNKISGGNAVTPVMATIATITGDMDAHESRLVKIESATLTNASGTYGGNNGNGTITDVSGSMTIYTRTQATFASETLPVNAQHVIAFVTRYNDTKQVCIRNTGDVTPADPNAPVLSFTSATTASATVGEAFSHTFTTQEANLAGTTTFEVTEGTLPDGLILSDSTISGTPTTAVKRTLEITATNGTVTAKQQLIITVRNPVEAGSNLVVNGDFAAAWTSGIPSDWAVDVPANITVSQGQGVFTVENPTGTAKLQQEIEVEEGASYTISFDYTATHAKFRIWSGFRAESGGSITYIGSSASSDDLRTKNDYYAVASDLTNKSITFTVPTGQSYFWLEFRYYKQATSKFELKNVTLTKN